MNANSPFAQLPEILDYRFRIEFWAILGCVVLGIALVELVRRNQLKERYSLLWFLTVGVMTAFTVKRDWLEDLAQMLGVYYPPTALFLLLVFFMLLILIHFSTVISKLLNHVQNLVQKIGILEARIYELEKEQSKSSSEDSTSSKSNVHYLDK